MLKVKVDSDDVIRSLTKLVGEFQRTGTNAVFEASAELINNIVQKTLGPPPGPKPKYYVRTWRLVHGWGPAARFCGIKIPSLTPQALTLEDEGTTSFLEDESRTVFLADNQVPYASDVEFTGTWKTPYPDLRGGYNIVGSSLEEMRKENKFTKYVTEAWELAKNAT